MGARAVDDGRDELGRKSLVAFLWGAGGAFGRMALQLVAQIVLARIIGPAEYGLFAIGVLVIGLSGYFADIGIAYGLIQRQTVTREDIRFVWTWQLMLGTAVAVALFLGADRLAALFEKPESAVVFRWLSAVCFLNALAAVSGNLLRKALDFRRLQLGQLLGYFVGFVCVGIPLALAGEGVLALVFAWLVQAAVTAALLYRAARHPIRLLFWTRESAQMLRYGLVVLGTNLVNGLLNVIDKMLVGRVFPVRTVGLYTTAFNLVNAPAAGLYSNVQAVVFSSSARLQGDPAALRELYLGLVAGIGIFAFPLFAALAVGAPYVVSALYGPKWTEAAPYLAVFSLAMPFLLLWGASTPMLWNSGRQRLELALQLPMVAFWAVALWYASGHSALTVAAVAAGLFVLRCAVIVLAVCQVAGLPVLAVLRALSGGATVTALFVLALLPFDSLSAPIASYPVLQLLAYVVWSSAALCLLGIFVVRHVIDARLALYVAARSVRFPAPVRATVQFLVGKEA